jgi:hypothetical protein
MTTGPRDRLVGRTNDALSNDEKHYSHSKDVRKDEDGYSGYRGLPESKKLNVFKGLAQERRLSGEARVRRANSSWERTKPLVHIWPGAPSQRGPRENPNQWRNRFEETQSLSGRLRAGGKPHCKHGSCRIRPGARGGHSSTTGSHPRTLDHASLARYTVRHGIVQP